MNSTLSDKNLSGNTEPKKITDDVESLDKNLPDPRALPKPGTHRQLGFTLAETLGTVAILGILAGVAIPNVISLQKRMHTYELNQQAKTIYDSVQNQLTSVKAAGELDDFDRAVKQVSDTTKVAQDTTWADYTTATGDSDTTGKERYFINLRDTGLESVAEAVGVEYTNGKFVENADEDFGVNSEASKVNNGLLVVDDDAKDKHTRIVAEVSPSTGEVYSVWYWEADGAGDNFTFDDLDNRYRDESDREAAEVGYYAGGEIGKAVKSDDLQFQDLRFDAINAHDLYVKVRSDDFSKTVVPAGQDQFDPEKLELEVTLTGVDKESNATSWVRKLDSAALTKEKNGHSNGYYDVCLDGLKSDLSDNPDQTFYKQFDSQTKYDGSADAQFRYKPENDEDSSVPKDRQILLGTDITVSVAVIYDSQVYDSRNTYGLQSKTVNSLFQSYDQDTGEVKVANLRQLNNLRYLNTEYLKSTKYTGTNDSVDGIASDGLQTDYRISKVIVTSDINFNSDKNASKRRETIGTGDSMKIGSVADASTTGAPLKAWDPLPAISWSKGKGVDDDGNADPDRIFTASDGNGGQKLRASSRNLSNFVLGSSAASDGSQYAGLFGKVDTPTKFQDVFLSNFSDKIDSGADKTAEGALAGAITADGSEVQNLQVDNPNFAAKAELSGGAVGSVRPAAVKPDQATSSHDVKFSNITVTNPIINASTAGGAFGSLEADTSNTVSISKVAVQLDTELAAKYRPSWDMQCAVSSDAEGGVAGGLAGSVSVAPGGAENSVAISIDGLGNGKEGESYAQPGVTRAKVKSEATNGVAGGAFGDITSDAANSIQITNMPVTEPVVTASVNAGGFAGQVTSAPTADVAQDTAAVYISDADITKPTVKGYLAGGAFGTVTGNAGNAVKFSKMPVNEPEVSATVAAGGFAGHVVSTWTAKDSQGADAAVSVSEAGVTRPNVTSIYSGGAIGFIEASSSPAVSIVGMPVDEARVDGGSAAGGFAGVGFGATVLKSNVDNAVIRGGTTKGGFGGQIGAFTATGISVTNSKILDSTMTGTARPQFAGGFAGVIMNATNLTECAAYSDKPYNPTATQGTQEGIAVITSATGKDTAVGGFAGLIRTEENQPTTSVNKCYSSTHIECGEVLYAGGFVGDVERSSIKNSYSSGSNQDFVSGYAAGGFAGGAFSSTIDSCYSTVNVTPANATYAAGFVGCFEGGEGITNNRSLGYVASYAENPDKTAANVYVPIQPKEGGAVDVFAATPNGIHVGSGNEYLCVTGYNDSYGNNFGAQPAKYFLDEQDKPAEWPALQSDGFAGESHPYSVDGKFPFAGIDGLNHYGDWPMPVTVTWKWNDDDEGRAVVPLDNQSGKDYYSVSQTAIRDVLYKLSAPSAFGADDYRVTYEDSNVAHPYLYTGEWKSADGAASIILPTDGSVAQNSVRSFTSDSTLIAQYKDDEYQLTWVDASSEDGAAEIDDTTLVEIKNSLNDSSKTYDYKLGDPTKGGSYNSTCASDGTGHLAPPPGISASYTAADNKEYALVGWWDTRNNKFYSSADITSAPVTGDTTYEAVYRATMAVNVTWIYANDAAATSDNSDLLNPVKSDDSYDSTYLYVVAAGNSAAKQTDAHEPGTVLTSGNYPSIPKFSKDGMTYVLAGWVDPDKNRFYSTEAAITVDGDMRLVAVYKAAIEYTITWKYTGVGDTQWQAEAPDQQWLWRNGRILPNQQADYEFSTANDKQTSAVKNSNVTLPGDVARAITITNTQTKELLHYYRLVGWLDESGNDPTFYTTEELQQVAVTRDMTFVAVYEDMPLYIKERIVPHFRFKLAFVYITRAVQNNGLDVEYPIGDNHIHNVPSELDTDSTGGLWQWILKLISGMVRLFTLGNVELETVTYDGQFEFMTSNWRPLKCIGYTSRPRTNSLDSYDSSWATLLDGNGQVDWGRLYLMPEGGPDGDIDLFPVYAKAEDTARVTLHYTDANSAWQTISYSVVPDQQPVWDEYIDPTLINADHTWWVNVEGVIQKVTLTGRDAWKVPGSYKGKTVDLYETEEAARNATSNAKPAPSFSNWDDEDDADATSAQAQPESKVTINWTYLDSTTGEETTATQEVSQEESKAAEPTCPVDPSLLAHEFEHEGTRYTLRDGSFGDEWVKTTAEDGSITYTAQYDTATHVSWRYVNPYFDPQKPEEMWTVEDGGYVEPGSQISHDNPGSYRDGGVVYNFTGWTNATYDESVGTFVCDANYEAYQNGDPNNVAQVYDAQIFSEARAAAQKAYDEGTMGTGWEFNDDTHSELGVNGFYQLYLYDADKHTVSPLTFGDNGQITAELNGQTQCDYRSGKDNVGKGVVAVAIFDKNHYGDNVPTTFSFKGADRGIVTQASYVLVPDPRSTAKYIHENPDTHEQYELTFPYYSSSAEIWSLGYAIPADQKDLPVEQTTQIGIDTRDTAALEVLNPPEVEKGTEATKVEVAEPEPEATEEPSETTTTAPEPTSPATESAPETTSPATESAPETTSPATESAPETTESEAAAPEPASPEPADAAQPEPAAPAPETSGSAAPEPADGATSDATTTSDPTTTTDATTTTTTEKDGDANEK